MKNGYYWLENGVWCYSTLHTGVNQSNIKKCFRLNNGRWDKFELFNNLWVIEEHISPSKEDITMMMLST